MGAREAAVLLGRMLTERPRYRRRWERKSRVVVPPDEVHQPAVCQVIVDRLIDDGEMSEQLTNPTRRIRDRVRRALAGEVLSPQTLRWFVTAFDMTVDDADQLTAALTDAAAARVVIGRFAAGAMSHRRASGYRTVSLSEHHFLDHEGVPFRHRTSQVIEATEDGLSRYSYGFDTAALTVHVEQGGRIAAAGPQRIGDELYGVDIELTRPLRMGETTTLTYATTFAYPDPPPPMFRRATSVGVDSVDLRVQFHPERVPSAVRYATWADLDAEPTDIEDVPVEPDHSVQRYLRHLERAIVGFHWRW